LRHYVDYALKHPNHYRMWFETGQLRWKGSEMELSHGRLQFVVFQPWLDALAKCSEAGYLPKRTPCNTQIIRDPDSRTEPQCLPRASLLLARPASTIMGSPPGCRRDGIGHEGTAGP
jgi:hypothetical protein